MLNFIAFVAPEGVLLIKKEVLMKRIFILTVLASSVLLCKEHHSAQESMRYVRTNKDSYPSGMMIEVSTLQANLLLKQLKHLTNQISERNNMHKDYMPHVTAKLEKAISRLEEALHQLIAVLSSIDFANERDRHTKY